MVHREEHNEGFTLIDNAVLSNVNLSWEARGFLCYLLSLPDDWSFSIKGLVKQTGATEHTVKRLVKELQIEGYIVLTRHTNDKGKVERWSWDIYEAGRKVQMSKSPQVEITTSGKSQMVANPDSGSTTCGKTASIQSTKYNKVLNIQNTKYNKTLNKDDGVVSEVEKMFIEFWSIYPKKVDKKGSFRAFKNIPKLKEVFPGILKALEVQKQSSQWTKDNGQYIPNPTTYIHQERWLTVNEADALQAVQDQITMNSLDDFNFWGGEEDAQ